MDYTIIIPTHNKCKEVVWCLDAILEQDFDGKTIELIVIDDGSKDGTGQALQAWDSRNIPFQYRRLEGRGPACARNEGIRHSRGRVICMIDDDAIPQKGWFRSLVKPFEDDENVVGVEGKVVPSGEDYGPLGMSPQNLLGGVYLTCNIAYRRDVLIRVGGFDEGFPFPAYEDTDLAAAVESHGRIAWAPDAVVYHPRRRWSLERALREVEFNRALCRFARRYGALGWKDRKVGHPLLRVCLAACLTLPAGRVLVGLHSVRNYPRESTEFIFISIVQGMWSFLTVWSIALEAKRLPEPERETSLFE